MTRIRLVFCFLMALAVMNGGCATRTSTVFVPSDLDGAIRTGHLVQKADNFLVILDCSGSMADLYGEEKKFVLARETVRNMIEAIPRLEMNLQGGLRVFGLTMNPFVQSTDLLVDMGPLHKKSFAAALDTITFATGKSNLAQAIAVASDDLDQTSGSIALIIVSDGRETTGEAARAMEVVKNFYGDRLCVYALQVGQDIQGRAVLERLARKGRCGYWENVDNLASPLNMADFVTRVLLKNGPDTDTDSVPDRIDQCPDTPAGATVDKEGCWQLTGLAFETNKARIDRRFHPVLDKAVAILEQNPGLGVLIGGHTDKKGPDRFNQKLSLDRAQAVMDYMVEKGIAPERLSVRGFGSSKPIAPNNTEAGRAQNRRVTLSPVFSRETASTS